MRGTALVTAKDREAELPWTCCKLTRSRNRPRSRRCRDGGVPDPNPDLAPVAMLHSLWHFKSLHEQNVIPTIRQRRGAAHPDAQRVKIEDQRPFPPIELSHGYAGEPDVPARRCNAANGAGSSTSRRPFILCGGASVSSTRSRMPRLAGKLYMPRHATPPGLGLFPHPAGPRGRIGAQTNIWANIGRRKSDAVSGGSPVAGAFGRPAS